MTMHGKLVQIVENPRGWWGPSLMNQKGIAITDEEAGEEFYHLTNTTVPAYLLFHECRLEVIE